MAGAVFMAIEILLLVGYLVLVVLVYDTSSMGGLIKVGVTSVIVFPLVLILEKRREKMANAATVEDTGDGTTGDGTAETAESTATQPAEPVAAEATVANGVAAPSGATPPNSAITADTSVNPGVAAPARAPDATTPTNVPAADTAASAAPVEASKDEI
jgi:hypothetical protein